MRHFHLTILISILLTTLTSGSQTNKSDNKEKALIEKENKLLKRENKFLKKEQELNQKSSKTATDNSIVKQQHDNSNSNNLDFLKKLDGKYPYAVGLFNKSAFTQRLKKLIGNSRYRFLKKTWAVQVPMNVDNNTFVAIGCQAHNCDATNFIIVVDFSKNLMYVGIKEEDEIKTYSEDGSYSPEVNEWVNGN